MKKKPQSEYCLIRVFSDFNNLDYDEDERWASPLPSVFHVKRNIKCQRSQTTLQDMLSEVQMYCYNRSVISNTMNTDEYYLQNVAFIVSYQDPIVICYSIIERGNKT